MDYSSVQAYITSYWPRIIRSTPQPQDTLIALPRPYLVPSDRSMFAEMYYWDSYFMSLGLVGTPHEELILDMTENLAYLFECFGIIPNGSRYYFLSRSQPPLFTSMIWLAYDIKRLRGDLDAEDFLQRMIRLAEREHETVWSGKQHPHYRLVYEGLSRYFDINYLNILAACESGWDHSTRCKDDWLNYLPVDLNSILYMRECDFAYAAEMLGQPERAVYWRQRAAERAATMQRLMWDEQAGFFFDYDWVSQQLNLHPSLAGFYPLWAGLATPAQAERVVRSWLPRFEYPGGLVTSLEPQTGRQWAYPNGWAPLQWLVVMGLDRYGYSTEAQRLRRKWCDLCAIVFAATGTMWEKYNVVNTEISPEGGLYGSVTGFGWSNAVFVDFVQHLSIAREPQKAYPSPSRNQ